ncbi:MAG: helix-turn-helix transcriptional regulator [Desulfitobacterium sp.]
MANRIKEILQRQGLTQKELAEKTGIDPSELSKIILEKKTVTLPVMKRISKALGWGMDHIWPD